MPSLGNTLAALKRQSGTFEPQLAGSGQLRDAGAFTPNPGALKMWVHVPEGLATNAPLVVVLHGCGQTAEAYASGSGWITLANRFGFALLCPEQTRSNNANLCFNWFEPGDIARAGGEAASIVAMVDHAIREYDLDAGKVFVTGLSAGGAMTAVMLATYPETFAGGAVIAGLPYGSARSMSEAFAAMNSARTAGALAAGDAVRNASGGVGPWPPISIWHGQSDAVVRPGAGEALAAQWANVHGVAGPPVTARTPSGRDFLVWLTPDGDPVVELHRIPGMGHGTPLSAGGIDGSGTAGPFLLEVGVSSSLEIALGWGIAQPSKAASVRPANGTKPKVRAIDKPTRRVEPPPVASPSASPATGVAAVIEQALRTAGLMK